MLGLLTQKHRSKFFYYLEMLISLLLMITFSKQELSLSLYRPETLIAEEDLLEQGKASVIFVLGGCNFLVSLIM